MSGLGDFLSKKKKGKKAKAMNFADDIDKKVEKKKEEEALQHKKEEANNDQNEWVEEEEAPTIIKIEGKEIKDLRAEEEKERHIEEMKARKNQKFTGADYVQTALDSKEEEVPVEETLEKEAEVEKAAPTFGRRFVNSKKAPKEHGEHLGTEEFPELGAEVKPKKSEKKGVAAVSTKKAVNKNFFNNLNDMMGGRDDEPQTRASGTMKASSTAAAKSEKITIHPSQLDNVLEGSESGESGFDSRKKFTNSKRDLRGESFRELETKERMDRFNPMISSSTSSTATSAVSTGSSDEPKRRFINSKKKEIDNNKPLEDSEKSKYDQLMATELQKQEAASRENREEKTRGFGKGKRRGDDEDNNDFGGFRRKEQQQPRIEKKSSAEDVTKTEAVANAERREHKEPVNTVNHWREGQKTIVDILGKKQE
eukprot:CAMPEP_0115036880 /NCGR_PEP_ID=MMETSP0216-20121206/42427_1 /TAXON_ID=223996 /ORGANISM="Protocruzia adherens, Strain Boccale" /LENGTH=423 /DNA_ID=CAMNT_0002416875 /DNA_START=273 /DNA_END=1544 /DNA_ORIENTATION=+